MDFLRAIGNINSSESGSQIFECWRDWIKWGDSYVVDNQQ